MPKKQTAKNKSKRVLIISDPHCGHELGLTPPSRQSPAFKEAQSAGWNFFTDTISKLGQIDLCICNGDLVDGPGVFGSREQITADTDTQIKIAIECLEAVKAKKYIFTRGTPVHVTSDREIEDSIARHFKAEIRDEIKVDVNGCVFHCRHTTGKGGTAYGSTTSLQRSAVVQTLNDAIDQKIKADIFIRSHIHEYNYLQRSIFTVATTPCLQFKGSSYGRKCTGFYDYGLMWFDIAPDGHFTQDHRILELTEKQRKEDVIKV